MKKKLYIITGITEVQFAIDPLQILGKCGNYGICTTYCKDACVAQLLDHSSHDGELWERSCVQPGHVVSHQKASNSTEE